MNIAYLDNSATTQVCEEAAKAVYEMMTRSYGNPSSLHSLGTEAYRRMERARGQIADFMKCEKSEIYFTSGGTEGNNLCILGAAQAGKRKGRRIVTTQIEHASVDKAFDYLEKTGYEVVKVPPEKNGSVNIEQFAEAVTSDTILVSMMLVNNETGALQPAERLRSVVRQKGSPALIHCDAVQAFGKMPVYPSRIGADLMTISGHKIHGPKGVGVVYKAKSVRILPQSYGGEQERALRAGTEAVPNIVGLAAAVEALPGFGEETARISGLKKWIVEQLGETVLINSPENGLPFILNLAHPGVRSEIMLHHMASRGVYVSSGSACSKGKKSGVLKAMGLPEQVIDSALRISFSRYSSMEDAKRFVEAYKEGLRILSRVK